MSEHRKTRRHEPSTWSRALIGVAAAIVLGFAVNVSYHALTGLPGQNITRLTVQVPDAKQLARGDTVRIGGARVGFVEAIEAARPRAPYASVRIGVTGDRRIPIDSTASVTPVSILGGKSVQITRGRAEQVLRDGDTIPLSRTRDTTDLNDALETFSPATRRGLQGFIGGLGDAFAGRGDDVNVFLAGLRPLLPTFRRTADLLADPRTDLGGYLDGAAAFLSALRPVAAELPEALGDGATTFAALDARGALGQVLAAAPAAEAQSTTALRTARPVLRDLAAVSRELRPAADVLPRTSRRLTRVLREGQKTFAQVPPTVGPVRQLVGALRATLPPRSRGLADSLVSLRASVRAVSELMSTVEPAQRYCNLYGTYYRNAADTVSEGDASGGWINLLEMQVTPMTTEQSDPKPADIHRNTSPIADARGCSAGKEDFVDGIAQTGNPAKLDFDHEVTEANKAVVDRSRAAGLLEPTPGTRLP